MATASNALQRGYTNKPKGFSAIVNSDSSRAMIDKSIGNPQDSARFVSTLISVVNANWKLSQCDPGTIISAALRGEIGMGLSMALGEYAIVPYGKTATFQLQTNGLKQLAVRSGKYAKMGFFDVRKGEYKGRDRFTREPVIEWIEDDDDREELPIVGYYGFYKLKESAGGMEQCIYWTHQQILKHADRYSKAFNLETYNRILDGKIGGEELAKLRNGSPWYDDPMSVAHRKMCLKTIAKQLLSDGSAPKQIRDYIYREDLEERTGEAVIFDEPIVSNVSDEATVMDAVIEPEFIDVTEDTEVVTAKKKTTTKQKSGSSKRTTKVDNTKDAEDDDDIESLFFE